MAEISDLRLKQEVISLEELRYFQIYRQDPGSVSMNFVGWLGMEFIMASLPPSRARIEEIKQSN